MFGLNGVAVVPLSNAGLHPMLLLASRFWLAWVGLSVLFLLWRRRPRGLHAHFGRIVAFAALLTVTHLGFLVAVSIVPVAVAVMVGYTAPVLLLAVESLALRRRPSAAVLSALLLALVGAAMVVQPTTGQQIPILGLLALGLHTFAYAGYLWLAGRVPPELDSPALLWWTWLIASVGSTPFAIVQLNQLSAADPVLLLYLGVGGTLIPFLLLIYAVRRAPVPRVAIVAVAEVPFAAIGAFVLLGQALGPAQILGGTAVAASIGLISLEGRPRGNAEVIGLP